MAAAAMNALPAPPPFLSLHTVRGERLRLGFVAPRETRIVAWLTQVEPDVALQRIGLAFSLCRVAQRSAAQLALQAAGATLELPDHAHLSATVHAEWLREHACNLQLSWPRLLGQPEEPALVRALLQGADDSSAWQGAWTGPLTHDVLGISPARFLTLDRDGLAAWCAACATPTAARFARWRGATPSVGLAPTLPPLEQWQDETAATLAQHMCNEADFCARPHWRGQASETGAHVRQRNHALLQSWRALSGDDAAARMLARLIELARTATGDACAPALRAWRVAPGEGLAAVETARGPLLHWVRVAAGKVSDYRIVAPTEWNFRVHGVLERALAQCAGDTTAQARAWILALDPCAECSVETGHA